jgi:hypothetical protein
MTPFRLDVQLPGMRHHSVQLFPGVHAPICDDVQLPVLALLLQRRPQRVEADGVLADASADLDIITRVHGRSDVLVLGRTFRGAKGVPDGAAEQPAGVPVLNQYLEVGHPVGLSVLEGSEKPLDVRSIAAHGTSSPSNLQISSMAAKAPGSWAS